MSLADWRSITNEKEKYAAYLCSREWAEKREAVRERSRGKCERCKLLPMDACHHLSYERKYAENQTDLQAICNSCHEFTHGKSDYDPLNFIATLQYLLVSKARGVRPMPFEVIEHGWHAANKTIATKLYIQKSANDLWDGMEAIEMDFDLSAAELFTFEVEKFSGFFWLTDRCKEFICEEMVTDWGPYLHFGAVLGLECRLRRCEIAETIHA